MSGAGEQALRRSLRRLRGEASGEPLAVAILGHARAMRTHADMVESLVMGGLAVAMSEGLSLDEVRSVAFALRVDPDELGDTKSEAIHRLLKLGDVGELIATLRESYPHTLDFVL